MFIEYSPRSHLFYLPSAPLKTCIAIKLVYDLASLCEYFSYCANNPWHDHNTVSNRFLERCVLINHRHGKEASESTMEYLCSTLTNYPNPKNAVSLLLINLCREIKTKQSKKYPSTRSASRMTGNRNLLTKQPLLAKVETAKGIFYW